ncbi:hypothetical protein RHMOL_Rhmol04G0350900 [Rhododendron molle]|uniref:Uncharacterized protein n=1 Tax=Rhododendron molle TaxID=49168 RepID=A0ACC0P8U5_RHOML|nr:hypothetical protein RHMOL_Rhmol04G0350900 [Rhododendron molle]
MLKKKRPSWWGVHELQRSQLEAGRSGLRMPGCRWDSGTLFWRSSHEKVGLDVDNFTSPEGIPGAPETSFSKVEEVLEESDGSETLSVSESAVTNVMASEERVEESAPDEDFAADPSEAERIRSGRDRRRHNGLLVTSCYFNHHSNHSN